MRGKKGILEEMKAHGAKRSKVGLGLVSLKGDMGQKKAKALHPLRGTNDGTLE